jgi:hypothetical protein
MLGQPLYERRIIIEAFRLFIVQVYLEVVSGLALFKVY